MTTSNVDFDVEIEGLDTDDEFWLVPASEWHIEPGPRKFVKQLPETVWLTLSGAKAKARC